MDTSILKECKDGVRRIGLAAICTVLLFTGCSDTRRPAESPELDEEVIQASVEVFDDAPIDPSQDAIDGTETLESESYSESITNTSVPLSELIENSIYPYEAGQIMIIMYHGIIEGKSEGYHRNIEDFKKDLQTLYDGGYRLISMSDLIDNNIEIPAGYTPVIISFDDGLSTSFSLREENSELVPATDCGVDILTKFAEGHPDFGNTAIFYINGDKEAFQGAGTLEERFKYLVNHGYELGNHTYSHTSLSELDAGGIQEEIGKIEELVRSILPEYEIRSLSYPNGIRPREELREYALSGTYNGITYNYALAVREGQSGASAAPNHIKFDPLNIPRVRGSDETETDLWWSLRMFEQYPERRYVSSGDPDRIVVPQEYADNVNVDSLNGKELILYSLVELNQ